MISKLTLSRAVSRLPQGVDVLSLSSVATSSVEVYARGESREMPEITRTSVLMPTVLGEVVRALSPARYEVCLVKLTLTTQNFATGDWEYLISGHGRVVNLLEGFRLPLRSQS